MIKHLQSSTRGLTLLGSCALLAMSAMAQAPHAAPESEHEALVATGRLPTLDCCKCLGGVTTLDLSTTATSAWRVNNSPVVQISSPNSHWDPLVPAAWVGPAAGAAGHGLPGGHYSYTLKFTVPACEIGGPVTINGQVLADDEGTVNLKKGNSPVGGSFSTSPTPPGWGFKINKVINFSYTLTPGSTYTLTIDVNNFGAGPTGLVVKATASRRCGKNIGKVDPPKDDKP